MSLRVLTPSILVQMDAMMDDNRYQSKVFTQKRGTVLPARNVRIAKVNQQQANVGEYIAMGLQVVNVIDDIANTPLLGVGATFDHDGNKWEIREPSVIGADNVTRTYLATTTIG